MTITSELLAWGPAVTIVLTLLLVSKELLDSSQVESKWLRWGMNAAIIPLLIVFLIQIVLLVRLG
jgi:hypothetical protein